jgi:hypothetical protein
MSRLPKWVPGALNEWYGERVVGDIQASTEASALLDDASRWFLANGREDEADLDRWVRSKRFAAYLRDRGVPLVRWGRGMVARGIRLRD